MKEVFRYSLRHSMPIFISFAPVGLAYGLMMQTAGFNWIWTGATCLFVFAGSLQFLAVSFLAGGVSLVTVTVMALLLNSRHVFYGIPFIEQWRKYGIWKLFLIYSLTDENFSLHCSNTFDDGNEEHKKWSFIFDALLTLVYWTGLSMLGAVAGSFLQFDAAGIDFALTALFIVILTEQIKAAKGKMLPAVIAAVSSVCCLIVFGAARFILPSLLVTVLSLVVFRKAVTGAKEGSQHE